MLVLKQRGFTLLEIAIVIVIVGVLTAIGAGMLTTMLKRTNAAATRSNADGIRQALMRFIGTYNRLPCPAVGTLTSANAAYGLEDAAGCINSLVGATGTARGVVPWKTLGLSQEAALDGYSRFFSFNVTVAATLTNSGNVSAVRGTMTLHSGTPPVLGLPPAGNQINACAAADDANGCNLRAVVVLVSHGENGYGAFNPSGTASPAPTSSTELANVDSDLAYVNSETSTASGTEFDDVVFAWAPGDFIDVLANQGQLRSATAMAQDALRNYAASISNDIVNNTTGVPPRHRIRASPATTATDPWGNAIVYSTPPANVGANVCALVDTTAFTLTSLGPDGVAGNNPTTGRADDIVTTVNVESIKSQISNGGPCTSP